MISSFSCPGVAFNKQKFSRNNLFNEIFPFIPAQLLCLIIKKTALHITKNEKKMIKLFPN